MGPSTTTMPSVLGHCLSSFSPLHAAWPNAGFEEDF